MPHDHHLISATGKLKLVPPNAPDDEATAILRTHPDSIRYLRFFPKQMSAEEARLRRERRREDPSVIDFNVHLINSDGTSTFAGICGLSDVDTENDSCGSVGVMISPEYFRRGFATDVLYTLMRFAFEVQNLHRLVFITGADNGAMVGWLENVAGVQLEFRWRECWKDGPGRYSDALGYSVLEWEWTSKVRAQLESRLNSTSRADLDDAKPESV